MKYMQEYAGPFSTFSQWMEQSKTHLQPPAKKK